MVQCQLKKLVEESRSGRLVESFDFALVPGLGEFVAAGG